MQRQTFIALTACLLGALLSAAAAAEREEKDFTLDLAAHVPADFVQFSFVGHNEQARLLNHYLWYHFHHRLGNGAKVSCLRIGCGRVGGNRGVETFGACLP